MLRRALTRAAMSQPWRLIASRCSTSKVPSTDIDSKVLRFLKNHFFEASKWNPPPKIYPPKPFTIVKGSMDGNGPVLKRTYKNEEISLYVTRLVNIVPGDDGNVEEDDDMSQLFLHVDISKPGQKDSLHFLCGLYADALGIHSVSMRPNLETSGVSVVPSTYNGPVFEDISERMRDALHSYIEERGVNESLFEFLRAWLYVKDHQNLMRWFKSVGTFIKGDKSATDA